MNPALIAKDVAEKRNFSNVNEIVSKKRFSNDICQMKISFILYVFQFFIKNQHLTSHGIMYVFVDFCKKIFLLLISISAKKFFYLLQLLRFLPVSSIPVVCIINTCITYDLTRLRCMNHLSSAYVNSYMSGIAYNISR